MKKLFAVNIFFIGLLFMFGCSDDKSSKNIANDILSDNKKIESLCDENASFNVLNELVTDGVIDKIKTLETSYDIDISKARASMASMKIVYGSIATTKKDPNSTQVFCKSQIKITIPSDMLRNIEKGYKNLLEIQGTFRNANIGGFESSANNFIKNGIEYNVQPTDDGKEIYAGFDNQTQLDEIVDFVSTAIIFEQVSSLLKKNNKNINLTSPQNKNISTGEYLKNYAHKLMTGIDMSSPNDIKIKTNSRGIKIYCLSDMSMCKTEAEVIDYFNMSREENYIGE